MYSRHTIIRIRSDFLIKKLFNNNSKSNFQEIFSTPTLKGEKFLENFIKLLLRRLGKLILANFRGNENEIDVVRII